MVHRKTRARLLEDVNASWVGMPVAVALARTRDAHLRGERSSDLWRERGLGAVVPDLEEVHVADVTALDRRTRLLALGVGGEKGGERPAILRIADQQLERSLVALPRRRLDGRDGPHAKPSHAQDVAVSHLAHLDSLGETRGVRSLRHDEHVDADDGEKVVEAARVVGVEVREDDGVEMGDVASRQGAHHRLARPRVHEG